MSAGLSQPCTLAVPRGLRRFGRPHIDKLDHVSMPRQQRHARCMPYVEMSQ